MAPIGAWGRIEQGTLALSAVVLSADGTNQLSEIGIDVPQQAESLGKKVATDLIDKGADKLIAASRST
jgi:hydroxymethylbilane synthase